jgi:hypothetical protein
MRVKSRRSESVLVSPSTKAHKACRIVIDVRTENGQEVKEVKKHKKRKDNVTTLDPTNVESIDVARTSLYISTRSSTDTAVSDKCTRRQ